MKRAENSLKFIKKFFNDLNIQFWIEAGTALSAYRDGNIFPWEHDIDIAIWKSDLPDIIKIKNYFKTSDYNLIIQKGFPFIDNIIQLKVKDDKKSELMDIDIYLYSLKDDYAYMRWIQKPEGNLNKYKFLILNHLHCHM